MKIVLFIKKKDESLLGMEEGRGDFLDILTCASKTHAQSYCEVYVSNLFFWNTSF